MGAKSGEGLRMTNGKERVSTGVVARELGVSTAHVCKLIESGHLEAINVGAGKVPEYRVSRESIERFKENRTIN